MQVPQLFAAAGPAHGVADDLGRARPLPAGTGLRQVLQALFPCGSVTGAPKRSAMQAIAQLEDGPRGWYCGALGVVRSDGAGGVRATFNVPIRTVVLQGRADADAAALAAASPPMPSPRANGASGAPSARLPSASASRLRFWKPWRWTMASCATPRCTWRAWRRRRSALATPGMRGCRTAGAGSAGPGPPHRAVARARAAGRPMARSTARPWCQPAIAPAGATAMAPRAAGRGAQRVCALQNHAPRALRGAGAPAATATAFDSLLCNEDGEITEGTRGNIAALLDGQWVTPPLQCGLLPGVGRQPWRCKPGRVQEGVIRVADVPRVQAWAFINSLRGWIPAQLVGTPPAR